MSTSVDNDCQFYRNDLINKVIFFKNSTSQDATSKEYVLIWLTPCSKEVCCFTNTLQAVFHCILLMHLLMHTVSCFFLLQGADYDEESPEGSAEGSQLVEEQDRCT